MAKIDSSDGAATAIELVRMSARATTAGIEGDNSRPSDDFKQRVLDAVEHRTAEQNLGLIVALAQAGGFCALQIPDDRRELFLSMLAGEAESS